MSPDGRRIAYRGRTGDASQLFVRDVDALEPRALADTREPRQPFFSPDGEWIAYLSNAELRKVRVAGGVPVTICRTPAGALPQGASWGDDGTIVFGLALTERTAGGAGLFSVAASGGDSTPLTTLDGDRGEVGHIYPSVLPGSRGVLFRVLAGPGGGRISLLDWSTGEHREIAAVRGTAEYARQHVVFSDETGRLFALPFDLARLQPVAAPSPLPEQTYVPPVGQAQFSVALSGALVYVNAADGVPQLARSLVWVDQEGKEEPLGLPPRAYAVPRLSPDGTLVALDIRDQQNDIWIWSLTRQSFARFTTGPFLDMAPVWSSDGRRIIWTSTRNSANPALFWQAADGTGESRAAGDLGARAIPVSGPSGRTRSSILGGES